MAKSNEKPYSTCHKPIAPWNFQNPKPGFQHTQSVTNLDRIYIETESETNVSIIIIATPDRAAES